MEGNVKNKPWGVLVFGAPCSGKTVFAEKFAEKFNLVYLDLDELKAEKFSRRQIMTVLRLIAKSRQSFIIEGGLETEKNRTEIRNLLRSLGYDPALVWIQTDVSTIRARLKSRHRSVAEAKEVYDAAIASLEAPADSEKAIVLSGKHTFETQTRHTLKGLSFKK